MFSSIVGLDIGGANLKSAHSSGVARLRPFELWKNPSGLAEILRELLQAFPRADLLAVTMTGELCDYFATKREGVNAILDAVGAAAGNVPVLVWQNDGRLVDTATARATPLQTAAANWLALAAYAGRYVPDGPALLVDVGSTTTDIVPLLDGRPIPRGRTDPERLRCRELVYTGVRRTPVCALLDGFGAAELFATTLDVYLVLGEWPEDAGDRATADGRLATQSAAHSRLARMLGADAESCTEEETRALARQVRERQRELIHEALECVGTCLPGPPETVVLAGSGEFLARAAWDALSGRPPSRIISLAEKLGPEISQAACAYALAVLAAEQPTHEHVLTASPTETA